MNALSIPSSLSIRVATMADLPFMDALQKKHSKQLGYFPRKQFEGYIEQGAVLIAEGSMTQGSMTQGTEARRHVGTEGKTDAHSHFVPSCLNAFVPRHNVPLGYVISKDRYLKRDELGVIYQLCVVPGAQRKLVGASLIKEVFARSAYGCRLYCCWCAQDIQANYFWESLGFIPIAFRAGSDKKRRVHIFWQRRINAADETTRYWYPSQTNAGAIREDRLVFPIPPGVRWQEVEAVRLPSDEATKRRSDEGKTKALPNPRSSSNRKLQIENRKSPLPGQVAIVVGGRIKYVDRPGAVSKANGKGQMVNVREQPKVNREPKAKAKIDAKYVAAARELRDRYLEQINERGMLEARGKYEVARVIEVKSVEAMKFLRAA